MIRIFILMFAINCANAQSKSNTSGLIKYDCIRELGEYKMKNSKDQKHTSQGILLFNDIESSYFYVSVSSGQKEVQQYQNPSGKVLVSKERTKAKKYIIMDTMTIIPWKLSKDTKKIQNIECFSAQAEYRGRVWTAWYAPSIPISSGPWKLYGLPGMILEAEDREKLIRFECTTINVPPTSPIVIDMPMPDNPKEIPISTKKYALLAEQDILNAEKMSATKDAQGSGQMYYSVSGIEIFAFEKNLTMKRFQQKLSDTPKK